MRRLSLSKLRRLSVAALSIVLCSATALASALVPAPLRSAIIVRSAGYEKSFNERKGEAVLAVVVPKAGADDGKAMAEAFSKLLLETRVGNRKARVVQVVHESQGKTNDELSRVKAEIVYFSRGLEGIVNAVPAQAGDVRRILVCADGADVGQGCTLGVELDGDKPRIVLNLRQANAGGLMFASGLLRLARIVR